MNHSTMMSPTSPADPKEIHVWLKHIAKFFSTYAATLLSSGATTMRIERKLRQMAEAWQVQAEFTILPTNVILNIWDASGEHSYSCISPLLHGALNFDLITRLSRLSDDASRRVLRPPKPFAASRPSRAFRASRLSPSCCWLRPPMPRFAASSGATGRPSPLCSAPPSAVSSSNSVCRVGRWIIAP